MNEQLFIRKYSLFQNFKSASIRIKSSEEKLSLFSGLNKNFSQDLNILSNILKLNFSTSWWYIQRMAFTYQLKTWMDFKWKANFGTKPINLVRSASLHGVTSLYGMDILTKPTNVRKKYRTKKFSFYKNVKVECEKLLMVLQLLSM